MVIGWKFYGDGRSFVLGEVVVFDEWFLWGCMVGLGVQYVVVMFGVIFVFLLIMGFNV